MKDKNFWNHFKKLIKERKTILTDKYYLWHESWNRLKKNKLSIFCGVFIIFVCFVALFAEQLAPYPFDEQNIDRILTRPSWKNWIGTDGLGRDLFSRLIYGSRISMAVGIFSSLISLIFGVSYGVISGWFGGKVDAFMMRVIDIMYSIPALILIILIKLIFDHSLQIDNHELRALISILIAPSISGWMTLGRMVRGQVLQVKSSLYVESARALGAKSWRIIIKQIIPNILGPVIVLLTFQIPANVLYESFLSFLGLGLQPPYSSWGILAAEGWQSLRVFPHLMIAPGVALFLTMLAFNLLGDGLKDALEPQSN